MLESASSERIAGLVEREGIAPSYMTRVLLLTLRAPDIVEAMAAYMLARRTVAKKLAPVRIAGTPFRLPEGKDWNDVLIEIRRDHG